MATKTVYRYNKDGYYAGSEIAYESPLEPDVFLVPAGCVEVEPPIVGKDNLAQWDGSRWQEVPAPTPEAPEQISHDMPNNSYITFTDIESAYTEGVESA